MDKLFKNPIFQWAVAIIFSAGMVVATVEGKLGKTKCDISEMKATVRDVQSDCSKNSEEIAAIKKGIENIDKNIDILLKIHLKG